MLHRDFNQRNVSVSSRGWLAIDPRPMSGESADELAQWLVTRGGEEPDPVTSDRVPGRALCLPADTSAAFANHGGNWA